MTSQGWAWLLTAAYAGSGLWSSAAFGTILEPSLHTYKSIWITCLYIFIRFTLSLEFCIKQQYCLSVRSAGLVLLQTVPEGLGACDLRTAALRVPGVFAIHELHVWQLHRDKVVATAHVIYGTHEVNKLHNLWLLRSKWISGVKSAADQGTERLHIFSRFIGLSQEFSSSMWCFQTPRNRAGHSAARIHAHIITR